MAALVGQPGARSGSGGGFTLIELITVLVITAIVAAVALPSLAGASTTRRAMGANQIVRDLDYARERAISTGTRTWVVFNTGTNSYSVLQEDPTNPGRVGATALTDPANTGKTYVQYLGTGEFVTVTLSSVVSGTGSEIGFDWIGKPYDSTSTALTSAAVVTLTGGKTVTVQPITGLATTP